MGCCPESIPKELVPTKGLTPEPVAVPPKGQYLFGNCFKLWLFLEAKASENFSESISREPGPRNSHSLVGRLPCPCLLSSTLVFWKHPPSSGSLLPSDVGSQQLERRCLKLWHHHSLGEVGSVEGDGWEGGIEGRIMPQFFPVCPRTKKAGDQPRPVLRCLFQCVCVPARKLVGRHGEGSVVCEVGCSQVPVRRPTFCLCQRD